MSAILYSTKIAKNDQILYRKNKTSPKFTKNKSFHIVLETPDDFKTILASLRLYKGITKVKISAVPMEPFLIDGLTKISFLDISGCNVKGFKHPMELTTLIANDCWYLEELPIAPKMVHLNVKYCRFSQIPFYSLLEKLDIGGNNITMLPDFARLTELVCHDTNLVKLPPSNLTILVCQNSALTLLTQQASRSIQYLVADSSLYFARWPKVIKEYYLVDKDLYYVDIKKIDRDHLHVTKIDESDMILYDVHALADAFKVLSPELSAEYFK